MVCPLWGSHRPQRHLRAGGDWQHAHQGTPLCRRRKEGAFEQALGTSRGGRTSKLHAATDEIGRPRLILLTAGNASDAATAPALLAALGPFRRLVADRGYDSDAIRRLIAERGAEAVIPPSSPRVRQIPYDPIAYRQRNLVERLWCRLKDWRRIATRYDKLARNYLAGVYLAAIIIYWINWVPTLGRARKGRCGCASSRRVGKHCEWGVD
jgi:transposase